MVLTHIVLHTYGNVSFIYLQEFGEKMPSDNWMF